ncbi:2-hydroxychromene-2-carboxylate isomerase [Sedimenticola sp.]|uniref:2-hydroxychromene-2-carboxylate isomerase n=1 Tax=Sedimenticola sp. TaxID=1940285 RepID=UPI003D104FC4
MAQQKRLTWYYDFISPYAYLASQALDRFPNTIEIVRKPILFAGLLKKWETRGPAEIVPMRKFTYRQIAWLANRNAIPLKFPPIHPFNPLKLLRLNISLGDDSAIVDRLFRFVWAEGRSSDNPSQWAALLEEFGLSVGETEERIGDAVVKQQLITYTEQAIAEGIFGVPGFVVDDEVFWGFDSIPFINDYLEDPALISQPLMRQADGVGEGVKRG